MSLVLNVHIKNLIVCLKRIMIAEKGSSFTLLLFLFMVILYSLTLDLKCD